MSVANIHPSERAWLGAMFRLVVRSPQSGALRIYCAGQYECTECQTSLDPSQLCYCSWKQIPRSSKQAFPAAHACLGRGGGGGRGIRHANFSQPMAISSSDDTCDVTRVPSSLPLSPSLAFSPPLSLRCTSVCQSNNRVPPQVSHNMHIPWLRCRQALIGRCVYKL